ISECLLDGEILCWDANSETVLPFGHSRTVADGELADCNLFYVVFDLMEAVNKAGKRFYLEQVPYFKRREMLQKVLLRQRVHELEIIQSTLLCIPVDTDESEEVETCFPCVRKFENLEGLVRYLGEELEKVQEERREGIMIKQVSSRYFFNARSKGWFKLKPRFGWLKDSLDLVIAGFYLSDGQRRRRREADFLDRRDHISTFLLGVKEDEGYRVFTKCGTGYTIEELRDVTDELKPYMRSPDDADWNQIFNFWSPSATSEKPDYVILPQHSIVMEIMGAELVPSEVFDLPYTLRFPRAVKGKAFRRDKNYDEISTVADIKDILQNKHFDNPPGTKLNDSGDEVHTKDNNRNKKPKAATRATGKRDRVDAYTESLINKKTITQESNLFSKLTFYVEPYKDSMEVEKAILLNGGDLQRTYQTGKQDFVISHVLTARVKLYHCKDDISIYLPKFVNDCIRYQTMLQPHPANVLVPNLELKAEWEHKFDPIGDNYLEPINLDMLELLLSRDDLYKQDIEDIDPELSIYCPSKIIVLKGWDPQRVGFSSLAFNHGGRKSDDVGNDVEVKKEYRSNYGSEKCERSFDWNYMSYTAMPYTSGSISEQIPPQLAKYLNRYRRMNVIYESLRLVLASFLCDGFRLRSEEEDISRTKATTIYLHPEHIHLGEVQGESRSIWSFMYQP
ncbi:DNA ligase, partial [Gregarina niphandrodes]